MLLRRTRTHPALCLVLLCLPLLTVLFAGTARAAERDITGGRLDWGIRASFQTYVTGPVANGGWSLGDGAATVGESQFRFHSAQGSYDPDSGSFTAAYRGSVRFTGHQDGNGDFALDLTIANPSVSVSGSSGTLSADMRSKDRETGTVSERSQVPLAALDLTGVELRGGTGLAVAGIPATLTDEGAAAFAGYYAAGDPLDPVTLSADSTAAEEERPTATEAPDGSGDAEPDEDRDTGGAGDFSGAAVDWGVRRTFREYVGGDIAQGSWTVGDGALDGGALFRFTAGEGTADPGGGTVRAAFTGAVRFTGTDLDLTISSVTVAIADGTGTLSADVTTGAEELSGVPLVTFPADSADLAPDDGLILLSEVPAGLTEEGADAFGGLYAPGTEMDPVTLAIPLDEDAALPALPDLGSEPADAQTPEPAGTTPEPSATAAATGGDGDAGTPTIALIAATGTAAVLAAAAVVAHRVRRARRAAGAHTHTPEETDPS
ncbi:HtaA domain-containing protein [Streptomyces sp. RFCAC02]|uniref:HtaA domain-containing protein n=1 Tax=Streptomyces sp. RFCAC02 TaxID=2499143 RepID=UPI0010204DDF|nr:HtaA domain-containing protein [Streptomyces sp. RFCAC02]